MSLGAYIHIPFCNYKCHFCDFATSLALDELQDKYCSVLKNEIAKRLVNLPSKPQLGSIFYGGGTPGLLDAQNLYDIHQTLLANASLLPESEISLETTPETITVAKAKEWFSLGINRLSIGIESFNDYELKRVGRGHTSQQAVKAVKDAVKAGFTNISCDLMYGLPGQSLDIWQDSLNQFIKLAKQIPQIAHISAYGLELNNNGPLAKIFPQESGAYPSDETFVAQLNCLVKVLAEAGFEQYEISNFAKGDYRSKHNLNYWQDGEYHAFGVSAHRYIKPYRSSNWRILSRYLEDSLGDETCELIDSETQVKEAIMLGLRTTEGINLLQFEKAFAVNLALKHRDLIEDLIGCGVLRQEADNIRLTVAGQPIANTIIAKFF